MCGQLSAEQASTVDLHCGPSSLSPYGPLAECKFNTSDNLRGTSVAVGNGWAAALCFVLRARGFGLLGNRLASATNEIQSDKAEEVLQWASSRWIQEDGKNVKLEARFVRLSEFSSWISRRSLPVLLRIDGTPNILISAKLRCNEQSGLCDYVEGLVYRVATGKTETISLEDWKLVDEFVHLDVLTDAPFDDSVSLPDSSEVSAGS